MSDNYHNYQLLLAKAAQLYEKHGVGRREPFNVFSSLQNKEGHLNETLHSRFLHALLDYKKPGDETRENLKDFLDHLEHIKKLPVGFVEGFIQCHTKVERERHFERHNAQDEQKNNRIDILITTNEQAVVIENKSKRNNGDRDQDHQLCRYYNALEARRYSDIHLLYLTLDGHAPSDNSVGDLDRKFIKCISYKDIIPWLERCQKRDENEAALQDVVTQYLQLVLKLTGTDDRGKYMDELKDLLSQDNNLVLVQDLYKAMENATTELPKKLWNEIGVKLESEIPYLKRLKCPEGLYYQLGKATSLEVGKDKDHHNYIWFGIGCSKKDYRESYDILKEALKRVSGEEPNKWYPWWDYGRYDDRCLNLDLNDPKVFKLLSNKEDRQEFVKGIAQSLKPVLEILEDIAMVNAIKEGEKTKFVSEKQIFKILEGIS